MDKQQAQKIIRETFESPFDKGAFTGFIKNLLNRIDVVPFTYQGNYIPDAYKQYIKTLERIGKFSDGENNIDILVITLQKETSLERARTMQRNFVAWYLNGSRGGDMKDAALAAFVSPDEEDWRFSLVKMDYKFEKTKTGKVKVKEEFTPARRWSFLVGANEKSHTAQSRLVNILADDEHAPTLEEIEKAFDIETVTKEFFLKYRGLFLRTKEELDRVVKNDPKIKADFEAKGVDTVNFAKKLLGQIVFLYFLQKKGWFGAERDADWGDGSKHFLRELFKKTHGDYSNFFNDILEPLFYEALRIDRSHDDDYYSRFNCKIPFLNGGLFDPIGNYDWVHTDILLPDNLFSNTNKTKEGDTGNGILDIFDRYNFTVKEDEPLEKEVAIDPELLGKAYEKFNAIRPDNYAEFKKTLKSGKTGEENKFNKKFGVYYTPREIVNYMCRQSLISYLATELDGKVGKEDFEALIHLGEHVSHNEARVVNNGKETKTYSYKLSESIRNNAALIDEKLANIAVCDPAVGSGAFPVGMMSETVKARNVLSVFLNDKERTTYDFKRRCIEHSLYGVDIDPGAVEIAKLRLWLSLVVDEDDIKNIKPLPNLDYRIMQGNSLISEFMGTNFDSDKEKGSENLMFKDETDVIIEQFQQKKEEFLNESNVTKKSKLKEEVENLLIEIFETKLKTQKAVYFNRLKEIKNKASRLPSNKQKEEFIKDEKEKLFKESGFNLESVEKQLKEFTSGKKIKPFFLWNLYFSEVFYNKGGFDVVIANPPYISFYSRQSQLDEYKDEVNILRKSYLFTDKKIPGRLNTVMFFIERAISLLRNNGLVTLIVDANFHENAYKRIRKYILENSLIYYFVDKFSAFENVNSDQVILSTFRACPEADHEFRYFADFENTKTNNVRLISQNYLYKNQDFEFILDKKLMSSDDILKLDDLYETVTGIQIGIGGTRKSKGVEIKDLFYSDVKVNKKYYPIISLRSKDFYRYCNVKYSGFLNFDEDLGYEINKNVPKCNIAIPKYKNYLSEPKVIVRQSSDSIVASYVEGCCVAEYSAFSVRQRNPEYSLKYLVALLNSNFITFYSKKNNIIKIGNKKQPQIRIKGLNVIPVKRLSVKGQKPFIDLADKILTITKDDDSLHNPQKQAKVKALDREIDQMVYKLYGLTPEEIKIVEGENENAD